MVRGTSNSLVQMPPADHSDAEFPMPQPIPAGIRQSLASPASRRTASTSQGQLLTDSRRSRTPSNSQSDGIPSSSMQKRQNGGESTWKLKVQSQTRDDESEITVVLQNDGSWKPRAECRQTRCTDHAQDEGEDFDQESDVSIIKHRDGTCEPFHREQASCTGQSKEGDAQLMQSRKSSRVSGRSEEGNADLLQSTVSTRKSSRASGRGTEGDVEFLKSNASLRTSSRASFRSEKGDMQSDGSLRKSSRASGRSEEGSTDFVPPNGSFRSVKSSDQDLRMSRGTNGHEPDGETDILMPDGTFKPFSQVHPKAHEMDGDSEILQPDGSFKSFSPLRSSGCHNKGHPMHGDSGNVAPDSKFRQCPWVCSDDCDRDSEVSMVLQKDGSWQPVWDCRQLRPSAHDADRVLEVPPGGHPMDGESEVLQPDGTHKPYSKLSHGRHNVVDTLDEDVRPRMSAPIVLHKQRDGSLSSTPKAHSRQASFSRHDEGKKGSGNIGKAQATRHPMDQDTDILDEDGTWKPCNQVQSTRHPMNQDIEILDEDGTWKPRNRAHEKRCHPMDQDTEVLQDDDSRKSVVQSQRLPSNTNGSSKNSNSYNEGSEVSEILQTDGIWRPSIRRARMSPSRSEKMSSTRSEQMRSNSSERMPSTRSEQRPSMRSGQKSSTRSEQMASNRSEQMHSNGSDRILSTHSQQSRGEQIGSSCSGQMRSITHEETGSIASVTQVLQEDGSWKDINEQKKAQLWEAFAKSSPGQRKSNTGSEELVDIRYFTASSQRQQMQPPRLLNLGGVKLEGDPKVLKALSATGIYALDEGNIVNSRPIYRHMERPRLVLAFSGQAWFVQPANHMGRSKGCICLVDDSWTPDRATNNQWWVFNDESFVQQPSVFCSHYRDADLEKKHFPQHFS